MIKKYLFRLFAFVLILIGMDRLVNYALQPFRPVDYKLFIDEKKQFFEKQQYYDVLLIGDSHIADAVDPRIIKQHCGLEAFNMGVYHATPYENYFTLLNVLGHMCEKPKLIIIGTNPEMFSKPAIAGEYTPLIINDWRLRWQLNLNSEESLEASHFFKCVKEKYLFGSFFKQLRGEKYKPTRIISRTFHGYLESRNQSQGIRWKASMEQPEYVGQNTTQLDYFEKAIDVARKLEIDILILNPPVWSEKFEIEKNTRLYKDFSNTIARYSKQYNIRVFNINENDQFEREDFLNADHLNYYGAVKFSKALSYWLNSDQLKSR
jgi:hypothetical protein